MFVTKDVNIPNEIFEALENGKLVIFAGAGVSVDPPSNLPSFTDLAKQIGEGCTSMKKREAIDLYLGRLQNEGVMVHDLAKSILGDAASRPTKLHTGIVNLFKEHKNLRIVTTNFDPHFSKVIDGKFPGLVDTYYAPALPLGEQFTGLIYLHGSVNKESKSIVLTDSDFGHAYLTSGWATRFLQGMFAAYTVLFIGYSLNDPIMTYLSRGLALHHVAKPKRFAFTTVGQEDRWKSFGIQAITFPKRLGRLPYNALPEAITRWVSLTNMGALDHDERIKKIVSSPPTLEVDIIDYLETALKSPVWVQSFVRYANSLEWLLWASEKPGFKLLFTLTPVDECSQTISRWIAEQFVTDCSDEVMSIVQKNHRIINPVLWNDLAATLAYKDNSNSVILNKWIEVLLSTYTPGCAKVFLEYLLDNCKCSIDTYAPVQLFDFLTRLFINLEPNFAAVLYPSENRDKVSAKISMLSDHYHLNRAWSDGIKNNIGFFVDRFELILTSRITEAHFMLKGFEAVHNHFDPMSYRRSAIEPHEQDRYPEEFDVIIDAARDVLEWLLINESKRGHILLSRWLMSKVPLLVRLAIHGMGFAIDVSSDYKLQWVINNKLLYAPGVKHETFQLLKAAYPSSSQVTRRKLLQAIMQQSVRDFIEVSEETADYERYNAIVWLKKASPECPNLEKYLKMQDSNHKFTPRENPDFDRYSSSGFVGYTSPMSVRELLISNPCEIADFLLTYEEDAFNGPTRSGLLTNISDAVSKKFIWARKLISMLQRRNAWESDLWDSVLRGLEKSELGSRQWRVVLAAINAHGKPSLIANSVADLLLSSIRKETQGLPEDCILFADRTGEFIFDSILFEPCEEGKDSNINFDGKDWLGIAMNWPGGKITEYWLYSLSAVVRKDKDLRHLPKHYTDIFTKVLNSNHFQATLGRVLLAGQALFLYSIDQEWAVKNVLTLFNWKNANEAKRAWEGYLKLGKWNEGILEHMIPLFESTLSRVETDIPHLEKRFAEFIATIAMFSSLDPTAFLLQYNRKVSYVGRISLIDHMRKILKEMEPKATAEVWSRWMQKYLTNRSKGVPVAMSVEEVVATLRLLPYLEPVFEPAVNVILKLPAPRVDRNYFYYELEKQKIVEKYPKEVAKVLLHLLPEEEQPFYYSQQVAKMVISLEQSGISQFILLSICDQLARLRYQGAVELRQRILMSAKDRGKITKSKSTSKKN
ncbi:DUF4020 domain-containing protein [Anaerospora sp.]|uniref:DUF4020 domain-containing protein n=1 Tax=Anaerospora sp. TaxID=1960278 RepID=UPI00289EA5E6|nr:DUF4020 domain-containing protein [Anaerospora sp.]